MEEIWKPVLGYEGLYKISNTGKCISLQDKNIHGITYREKELKGIINSGYKKFNLKGKQLYSHRLVAIHFIPNPLNLPLVCHKDETLDEYGLLYNGVDNLWWGTYSDNNKDCFKKGRSNNLFQTNHPMKGKFGALHHGSKKVNQYSLDGEFIKQWDSMEDIKINLGISKGNLSECCSLKRNKTGGFIWKFA